MDNIFIIFIISLLLLIINRKIDKFIFCVLLFVCYIVYFKEYYKEQYTNYSKNESVLKIHDKIQFFEENGMSKTEYEIKNGVQIKFDGDEMIEEKVNTLENTQVKKKSPEIPLKYGQTILLQCYAMEDRYLTGNREGYNKFSPTGENMEGVFSTNEDKQLHEWILYPMDIAKMNTPILFGEKVKIMPKHPTYTRLLVGYQELAPFAYNPYENKCGVFTQTISKINLNYDYHIWEIVSDFKNVNYSQPIYYNNHIMLKLKDRYLSGARQFGFQNNETNQQVYTVSEKEGKYELYWLIKNKKEPRIKIPNQIKLFENEISLLEPNSSRSNINLSKYDNDANNYYGSPIDTTDQIDIILDKVHYTQGNSICKMKEFLLVNFFKERNIKSGYLYTPKSDESHKIRFSVKTAGKDGIFTDLGAIFESDYLYEWNKDNNIVKLLKVTNKYVSVNILNINSFVEDNGYTNDSDFILKKYNEYFYLLKKIQDKTFVVVTNGAGQSLIEYNGLDVPRGGMFKYLPDKKIVTIDNHALFGDTITIESKLVPESALIKENLNYLEFPIDKNVQFIKVYPIEMGDNCSMELRFHDQSNNQIKFSRDEAIVKENDIDKTQNEYDVEQLHTNGENTEIEMDLQKETFVRGGIIENDTNLNNYVYKVKILVAGENKNYTTLETYNLDISQSKTIKFNINKKSRYVKAIILNCMNTCKFKLELF